ncbi:hypothetical protein CLPUN_10230 [Clostridium puniceum]|uniref:Uncharacterized protein n=1 Tax=Clostridium puniceum TaxID=29367 RepID=A0A1S8TVD2_9CLOT|nr:hypothetical protein CLPUN_10230 [Clostridium puniceum]
MINIKKIVSTLASQTTFAQEVVEKILVKMKLLKLLSKLNKKKIIFDL